jgi:hypothetical protein
MGRRTSTVFACVLAAACCPSIALGQELPQLEVAAASVQNGHWSAVAAPWFTKDGTGVVNRVELRGRASGMIGGNNFLQVTLAVCEGVDTLVEILSLAVGRGDTVGVYRAAEVQLMRPLAGERTSASTRLSTGAGWVSIESNSGDWIVGTARLTLRGPAAAPAPRRGFSAPGPPLQVDVAFRAARVPLGPASDPCPAGWQGEAAAAPPPIEVPKGRTASTYVPDYPLGLENLEAAIRSLPADRQQELMAVYNERDSGFKIYDPGCLAQAYLAARRGEPVLQDRNAINQVFQVGGSIALRGCINRDEVVRNYVAMGGAFLPPGAPEPTPVQRDAARRCAAEWLTDAFIDLATGGRLPGSVNPQLVMQQVLRAPQAVTNACAQYLR